MSRALLERVGLGVLIAVAVGGFALYPSYPNYDSVYALVWARELVGGEAPSFEAFRAPTEHPLAIAAGVVLQPLGGIADHALVLLSVLAFVAVVVAIYLLGRDSFSPWVGLAAAVVMLSRFDFPYLAVRAYVDIPFMAAVLWAAVLEARRPRRGGAVWVLLAVAGLLRPEGWALLGLYWLWMTFGERLAGDPRRPSLGERGRWLVYAVGPALLWVAIDWAVTGDALFSFHATSETVSALDRGEAPADLPAAMLAALNELVKPPVVLAGIAGLALSLWLAPRAALAPGIVLLSGVATFLAVGAAGFAVIDRYLIVAAAAFCVFAGFAVTGFTAVPGRRSLRLVWAAGSAAVLVAVVAFTLTRTLQLGNFEADLAFRSDSHASLERLLESGPAQEALAAGCGPVSTPTHKLIPDVRWILDLPPEEVVARSDPDAAETTARGLALHAQTRRGLELQGFDGDASPLTEVPAPGFEPLARAKHYTLWARCGADGRGGAGSTID